MGPNVHQIYQKKFLVEIHNDQPFVYNALGSHGFWGFVGENNYATVPGMSLTLSDSTRMDPNRIWNTRNNIVFYDWKPRGQFDASVDWLNYPGRWGNVNYCSDNCYEMCGAGPMGPAYKDYYNPDSGGIVLYSGSDGNFYQNEVLKCNDQTVISTKLAKTISCGNKANSAIFLNVKKGTQVTFYKYIDSKGQGYGDYSLIYFKQNVLSYQVDYLQRGKYWDNLVYMEQSGSIFPEGFTAIKVELW